MHKTSAKCITIIHTQYKLQSRVKYPNRYRYQIEYPIPDNTHNECLLPDMIRFEQFGYPLDTPRKIRSSRFNYKITQYLPNYHMNTMKKPTKTYYFFKKIIKYLIMWDCRVFQKSIQQEKLKKKKRNIELVFGYPKYSE